MNRSIRTVGVVGAAVLWLSAWGYEWPTDGSGNVVGDVGEKTVCFGPNGLTARQLRMIRVNGRRWALSPEGYLESTGTMVIVR